MNPLKSEKINYLYGSKGRVQSPRKTDKNTQELERGEWKREKFDGLWPVEDVNISKI